MDVESLLQPVSESSPAGEDLYGDPERTQIELAFESEAVDVDWREIVQLIETQATRTKDVWLGIYLARAGARLGRLDIAVAGTQFLAGMFERYWETMHPALDELGFQGRKGPCESLIRIGEFLGPLRKVALVTHPRLGSYSGDDLQRFDEEGASADGYGMFRAAINEVPLEELQETVAKLEAMRDALARIDRVLVDHADGDTGTDFNAAYAAVDTIRTALLPYAGLETEEAGAAQEIEMGAAGTSARDSGPRIAGRIESRDDVVRELDAIGDYYRRNEPGSPIPVVLERVRGWVTMDFLTLLKDITPDGITQAEKVLLARKEEDSDY